MEKDKILAVRRLFAQLQGQRRQARLRQHGQPGQCQRQLFDYTGILSFTQNILQSHN